MSLVNDRKSVEELTKETEIIKNATWKMIKSNMFALS